MPPKETIDNGKASTIGFAPLNRAAVKPIRPTSAGGTSRQAARLSPSIQQLVRAIICDEQGYVTGEKPTASETKFRYNYTSLFIILKFKLIYHIKNIFETDSSYSAQYKFP